MNEVSLARSIDVLFDDFYSHGFNDGRENEHVCEIGECPLSDERGKVVASIAELEAQLKTNDARIERLEKALKRIRSSIVELHSYEVEYAAVHMLADLLTYINEEVTALKEQP